MTVRTVARGSYHVAEDVTKQVVLLEFSDRVLDDDIDVDGADFCWLGWSENGGESFKWAERDGTTVAKYTSNPAGWTSPLALTGEKGPFVPGTRFRQTIRIYLVGAEMRMYHYYGGLTHQVQVNAEVAPETRYIKVYNLADPALVVYKDLSGWLWVVSESDPDAGTLKAKAWNDADDEPEAWDGIITASSPTVQSHNPYPRMTFRTLDGTHDVELATVEWEKLP